MQKVTSKDGTVIAYDRTGEGPALILVDGALCYRTFGPMGSLAAQLAPHFTVYTYDRRGRGDSGDTQPYAIEREVEDIDALIREAGGSAFLYGISSGAALALEAASRGLNIKKLAIYEPPFMLDDSRKAPEDYTRNLSELVAAGRRGDAVEYFMVGAVGMPREAVTPMRNAPMWPMLEAVAPTLVYDGRIMEANNWLPTRQTASITIPTLVMAGGSSPAWAHKAAETLAETIPNVQRRTLEGQTHEVAAEALAPVLVEFFK